MARSAKIYDFRMAANGSFTLLVEGSFYRIQSATGAVEVRRDGGSGIGPIFPGQGERDENFTRLTIVDKSGQPNVGFIVVSDGTFVDDRISGEVSVIDGNKSRTAAGGAYMWRPTSIGANFNHAQLWNPAGSGKDIIVDAFFLTSSLAGAVSVCRNTVALANVAPNAVQNALLNAGTAGVAMPKTESLAALIYNNCLGTALVNANGSFDFSTVLKRPIEVPPGSGLVFLSEVVGATISGWVSFFEEANQ